MTKVRYRRTKKSLNIDCASAMKYSMALQYASGSALDNSHTNTSSTTQQKNPTKNLGTMMKRCSIFKMASSSNCGIRES